MYVCGKTTEMGCDGKHLRRCEGSAAHFMIKSMVPEVSRPHPRSQRSEMRRVAHAFGRS